MHGNMNVKKSTVLFRLYWVMFSTPPCFSCWRQYATLTACSWQTYRGARAVDGVHSRP